MGVVSIPDEDARRTDILRLYTGICEHSYIIDTASYNVDSLQGAMLDI